MSICANPVIAGNLAGLPASANRAKALFPSSNQIHQTGFAATQTVLHITLGETLTTMRPIIVVIPPDNPRSHVAAMVAPIKSLLKDSDWTSQLLFLDDHTDAAGGPQWQHDTDQPHAVIWCFPRACDVATIRSLVAAGIPTVTYNRDFRFAGAGGVVADVTDVVQTQFNHLWDLGKRRFAVLSIDRPSPSIRQYRAVASELASKAGISHHFTELTFAYRGMQRPSERMIQRIDVLMSGPDAPDAILCSDIFSFRGL